MQKNLDILTVTDFNEIGLAKIIMIDDKHHWVNASGMIVSELAAHVVIDKSGNEEKYALVNKAGEMVVPYGVYNSLDFSIMENHDGTAFVAEKDDSTIALIDDKGKEITQFGYYDSIFQSCCVGLPEGHGPDYIIPYKIGKNTYVVSKNKKYGLINDKGEEIISCVHECEKKQDDEILAMFDCAGKMLSQFTVPVKPSVTNLVPKCNDEWLWGYVNQQNELIIPYQFRDTCEFKNGFAVVSDTGYIEELDDRLWFHIDETGKRLQYTIKHDENKKIVKD